MSTGALPVTFAGRRGPLFVMALSTSLLTVVTLGLYRFWMKTRLRRYYWSSVKPGGHPLEYVGEPLEKLLGFLTAVVVMAFYIGVVNLILMFGAYALFQGNVWAYVLSFVGVIPIIFFAQYRARRYVLARTRWRGIRFGVEPGAWGYAGRALLWWVVTILSFGILWPRGSYALEKYRTDRTFFGQARLHQGGSPWMLMGSSKHVWIGLLIVAIGMAGAVGMPGAAAIAFALVAALGYGWTIFGLAYYRVDGFRRLTAAKEMGGVRLTSAARPWRILRNYSLGYTLTVLCLLAVAVPVVGAMIALVPDFDRFIEGLEPGTEPGPHPPLWALTALGVALYFLLFILWGVFRQVFVGLPNLRHFAETLTVLNTAELAAIGQRERDEFAEAEGFADALDVGAAI